MINVQQGSLRRVGYNPLILNKRECFIENASAKKLRKNKN